ncbi:hypothetical protein D3C71_1866910 [compost metagenome]
MKPHPNTIKIKTTATFNTTKMLFTKEDSSVPLMSNNESKQTIMMAGTFTIPPSQGPCKNCVGISTPNVSNN